MSDWQPIETVPRDGTIVDLWIPREGSWHGRLTDCEWDSADRWHRYGQFFREEELAPSHWMPLPEPPATPIPTGERR